MIASVGESIVFTTKCNRKEANISAIAGNSRLLMVLVIAATIIATAFIIILSKDNYFSQEKSLHTKERELSTTKDLDKSTEDIDETELGEEQGRISIGQNVSQENNVTRGITIKMRFLDSSRTPLSGVSVRARLSGSSNMTESGSSGAAELTISVPEDRDPRFLSVNATLPWHMPYKKSMRAGAAELVDLGEIVLESAGAVSGRVLDRSGNPIEGIAVFFTDSEIDSLDKEEARREGVRSSHGRVSCGRTGSDGTFRAPAVRVGSRRFWSGGIDYLYSYSDPVHVVAGLETYGVEIVLNKRPREQLIECVVLDPEGKPVPDAWVRIQARNGSHGTGTDSQGRFKRLLKREGPYTLEATDPKGRYEKVRLEDVQPGAPDLVLQFMVPTREMRLLVSSSGPEALSDFTVAAWNSSLRPLNQSRGRMHRMRGFGRNDESIERTFGKTDRAEDGTVSMTFPEGEFFVTVRAWGYETVELGPFSGGLPPDLIEAVLDPVPGLSGRVVFEDGGIEGARISLHEQLDPDRLILENGIFIRSKKRAIESVVTGPDGSFLIHPGVSGTWYLRAARNGYAPVEQGPLEIDTRKGRSGIVLRLTRGGTIAGRVIMAPGRDPAGSIVVASRGDDFPITVRTDEIGAFLLERLTPGPWLVKMRHKDDPSRSTTTIIDLGSVKVPQNWSCIVKEGETTLYDIDLSHETVCILKGRIGIEGLLSSRWSASLNPAYPDHRSRSSGSTTMSDARDQVSLDGSFTIEVLETGTYNLTVQGSTRKEHRLVITDTVELTGGEMSWDWSIPFTKVEVRPPPSGLEGSKQLFCQWSGEGARKAFVAFRLESNEPVLLHAVPVGKFRIEQGVRHLGNEPVVFAESEAVAGETRVVTLR